MDTLAHLTAGFFLTKTLVAFEDDVEIRDNQKNWISWGIFCSQIPDLDEIIGCAVSKKKRDRQFTLGSPHHGEISHLPLLYIGIFGAGATIFPLFKSKDLNFAFKVFAANITAHLVMDSFGMGQGLRWLQPFHKKQVGIGLTNKIGPDDWRDFYFSKRVIYELIVFFLAAYQVYWERKRVV